MREGFLRVVVTTNQQLGYGLGNAIATGYNWSNSHLIFMDFFQKVQSGCACRFWWFAKFKPCLF